jgi:phosphate/sulfate permease
MMFKAVVEMLGAFFAGAPVSETARDGRARLMAFPMLTLAALVGPWLVLRR